MTAAALPASSEEAVAATAGAFVALIDGGWSLPLPGSGDTAGRWRALRDLGAADLPLARLAEGHADAVAVLAELGGPPVTSGERLGVWAAEPPSGRVTARRGPGGWRLDGRKQWCSGARVCTAALVTAHADDGRRLFLVDLSSPGVAPAPGRWAAPGMAGSDTADVLLDDVPASEIGGPRAYLDRPGFWHGGIGVAAVWAGGAAGVAAVLEAVVAASPDPYRDAAWGAVDVLLSGMEAALAVAAAEIDADPADGAGTAARRAHRVRGLVARAGTEVLETVAGALGAGPAAHDARYAAHAADLAVYLRQHHGQRDLAVLADLLRAGS
ncbi:acyl-CoA dehydrogenase family protein [Blastococcus sp. TML/M2B]|uniref:acyl-CoA dehydrogenase family protein n=1 Tax=unclassified Blastococcus TaxID=2619396 RepID=UPI00190C646B|nr:MULTISPECIES: acyl-CoA dehydrogenase family protein [unclassified Blastococcus]MBN1091131.1 acyl-CoA dehydrogenase family protein [Blastococcus sp. TML/M2B]MBN1095315.1 acyl-CoA dehydrogenase family protein [Blastococcus sp. TML/C7B]